MADPQGLGKRLLIKSGAFISTIRTPGFRGGAANTESTPFEPVVLFGVHIELHCCQLLQSCSPAGTLRIAAQLSQGKQSTEYLGKQSSPVTPDPFIKTPATSVFLQWAFQPYEPPAGAGYNINLVGVISIGLFIHLPSPLPVLGDHGKDNNIITSTFTDNNGSGTQAADFPDGG